MKMLYYTRKWMRFLAPDNGGPSGGGTSNPGQQEPQTPPDPLAGIDMDSIPAEERAKIEAVRTQFATLQKTATEKDAEARRFQSEKDKLTAQLNRINQTVQSPGHQNQPVQETTEQRVYRQLIADGMAEGSAAIQAKTMGRILEAERAHITHQLGQQFAPVAQLTLQQGAETAFNGARMQDRFGWSQIPEVMQQVWQGVNEIVSMGQQATPEAVQNLARMHFMAHAEQNPAVFAMLQNTQQQPPVSGNGQVNPQVPPMPAFPFMATSMGYPGATFNRPGGNPPPNPNAPRTTMDQNTAVALAQVTQQWTNMGLKPKS